MTTKRKPSVAGVNALANRIATDLMVSGSREMAGRLSLVSKDGRDLGGWSFDALVRRIKQHLINDRLRKGR